MTDKKLRIAFFTNAFPISSEPFIELQAAELIKRGHHVHVFGISDFPSSPSSSSEAVKVLLGSCSSNASWPTGWFSRALRALEATRRTLKKAGLFSLPILRPLHFRRTWANLSAVFQAELVAGHPPFDVLHCQFATLGEHVLKLKQVGLVSGALIIHFRGYDITEIVHAFGPTAYDHLWDEASGFIANCDYFRSAAIDLGCPPGRINVVGSGIDLSGFPYRNPINIGDGPVRILAVGRLSARKGFHTLIHAIAKLQGKGFNVKLDIIGDGEERTRLAQIAESCGISGNVSFKGRLPHAQIRSHLMQTHVFVAPSETSPTGGADAPLNTIKEAMAVGVPVCATRHGGIPEIVEEGVTGTLAREADPDDLACAIARLIDLEPFWGDMTQSARRKVIQGYEISSVTDKLLDVYDLALSGKA